MTEGPPAEPGVGRLRSDRLGGAVLLLAAIAVGLEALTFTMPFPTDPLGPKAFPMVSALLLAGGAARLLARPGEQRARTLPGAAWLGAAIFVAYALLLEPLGFFVATLSAFVALAVLFGGRPLRALVAGAAFAGALYLLFVSGLGLRLPAGSVFVIGG